MRDELVADLRREFTSDKRDLVIVARSQGKTIADCAELAGVSQGAIYRERKASETFATLWDAAEAQMKDQRAGKAHRVVEQIIADPDHKDRLAAAKVYLAAYDPDFRATADQAPADGRADQIAEALDRFTSTVIALAAKSAPTLPAPAAGKPELAAGEPD